MPLQQGPLESCPQPPSTKCCEGLLIPGLDLYAACVLGCRPQRPETQHDSASALSHEALEAHLLRRHRYRCSNVTTMTVAYISLLDMAKIALLSTPSACRATADAHHRSYSSAQVCVLTMLNVSHLACKWLLYAGSNCFL